MPEDNHLKALLPHYHGIEFGWKYFKRGYKGSSNVSNKKISNSSYAWNKILGLLFIFSCLDLYFYLNLVGRHTLSSIAYSCFKKVVNEVSTSLSIS